MNERTWINPAGAIHKPEQPTGPWTNEPDRVQWTAHGLDCLAQRNSRSGVWCGYVGVGPNHPWYATAYNQYTDEENYNPVIAAHAHGGLTFSDFCMTGPNGEELTEDHPDFLSLVCHTGGLHEKVWWLGFDCNHAYDLAPAWIRYDERPILGDVYRDLPYVRSEIESLAAQCAAAVAS